MFFFFISVDFLSLSTKAIVGDPVVSGTDESKIQLEGITFINHPQQNILSAAENAGFELMVNPPNTLGSLTLVGGPDRDLFIAYEFYKT